jgi:hypothetical protein
MTHTVYIIKSNFKRKVRVAPSKHLSKVPTAEQNQKKTPFYSNRLKLSRTCAITRVVDAIPVILATSIAVEAGGNFKFRLYSPNRERGSTLA